MKQHTLHREQIALGERANPGTMDAELRELHASTADILRRYPADLIETEIRARLSHDTERRASAAGSRFRAVQTMGFAAAACLVVALAVGVVQTSGRASLEGNMADNGVLHLADRAKGNGPILFVYRKEGSEAVLLRQRTKVSEGDVLQLSYVAAGDAFGAIISIDGNGVITRHYPDDGNMAGQLRTNGEIPLDFSYQLDSAPAYERFIFISGKRNFSVSSIITSIQNAGRFALAATSDLSGYLPAGVRMTEILLFK